MSEHWARALLTASRLDGENESWFIRSDTWYRTKRRWSKIRSRARIGIRALRPRDTRRYFPLLGNETRGIKMADGKESQPVLPPIATLEFPARRSITHRPSVRYLNRSTWPV